MSHDDSQPRRLEPYTSSFSAPDARTSNSTIGDGGGNGPFDPGNTPPLVFAFITLGFTLFGIVIAVIYKRCRSFPNPQEPLRQRSVPVRRCSVQKPKLWHVWTPVHQPAPDQERTNDISDWDAFLPLSASLVYPYSPPLPVYVRPQYVQGHVARSVPLENPEHRLAFRQPPADTILHVAVMISMPRPRQGQEPLPNRTLPENEFHLGVTQVKWTG